MKAKRWIMREHDAERAASLARVLCVSPILAALLITRGYADERVARVRADMPEMPDARRRRFITQYGIPDYDAGVLTQSSGLADYYERVEQLRAMSPLGLVGEPDDQAHLVLYLASDASKYATGAIFRANGGVGIAW